MGEMSGNEDVARFAAQAIANPLRGIVGLEVARGRKLRKRVARAPVGFGRLLCAQFAAVPDDPGFAPRAAACAAKRSTFASPAGDSGRRASTSGPTATPWWTR